MRRSTVLHDEEQPGRASPFRIWMLCAMPWLALVTGLSVYDHQRAIAVMARAQSETTAELALHWLIAAVTWNSVEIGPAPGGFSAPRGRSRPAQR